MLVKVIIRLTIMALFFFSITTTAIITTTTANTSKDLIHDDYNSSDNSNNNDITATITLREFLMHRNGDDDDDGGVYLAMGPAFFGFYGYFGALAGIEDELFGTEDNHKDDNDDSDSLSPNRNMSLLIENNIIRGVSGASAGAMAAILLAAGISPHVASTFAASLTLNDFEDYFGFGALMKGNKFESIMNDFILSSSPITMNRNNNDTRRQQQQQLGLQLEEAYIPIAVTTTNILPQIHTSWPWTMIWPWKYVSSLISPKILRSGSMARAARASACFPFLFQPVGWIDYYKSDNDDHSNNRNNNNNDNNFSLLIDGGIFDPAGYYGLKEIINIITTSITVKNKINSNKNKIRVLNMIVGGFGPLEQPPGPLVMSKELSSQQRSNNNNNIMNKNMADIIKVDSVLSLSIINLPHCGPFSMNNGPTAIKAAQNAIRKAMDRPIKNSISTIDDGTKNDDGAIHHYVLEIDASSFY